MFEDLQTVKQEIFEAKSSLDGDYPEWRRPREEAPDDYWSHDARRECFVTLITLLENAQLSTLFLTHNLQDEEWWEAHMTAVSAEKKTSVRREYEIMVRWFTFHGLAMTVEETLRAVESGTVRT